MSINGKRRQLVNLLDNDALRHICNLKELAGVSKSSGKGELMSAILTAWANDCRIENHVINEIRRMVQ